MRKTAQVTAINVINGMNSEQVQKVVGGGGWCMFGRNCIAFMSYHHE